MEQILIGLSARFELNIGNNVKIDVTPIVSHNSAFDKTIDKSDLPEVQI